MISRKALEVKKLGLKLEDKAECTQVVIPEWKRLRVPELISSNLKFLLQTGQDYIELGIILEDIQDGIVEPECRCKKGPMGQILI